MRAEAAAGRRRLLYGLGGLASAGFVVALVYAVDKGGQTYVEGESSAPLVIAVFGGFGMLIAAVLCFVAAYAIDPDGTPRRS